MSKFNSYVISTINNLKKNGSLASDLLQQFFPAYLSYPENKFHDYITLKHNKFEEGALMKANYLMKCTNYNYKTLLDKCELEAPTALEKKLLPYSLRITISKCNAKRAAQGTSQNTNMKLSAGKHSQTSSQRGK